jgi:hypothetical protein
MGIVYRSLATHINKNQAITKRRHKRVRSHRSTIWLSADKIAGSYFEQPEAGPEWAKGRTPEVI